MQKQTQEQNKKEWAILVGLCQRHKPQHAHHVKVGPWDRLKGVEPKTKQQMSSVGYTEVRIYIYDMCRDGKLLF